MSSTRSYLKPYKILTNGDMSGNLTSQVTSIPTKDQVCVVIESANTSAVGQWSVEASLDQIQWVPMVFSPVISPTASGINDLVMLDMKLLSFSYIRVKWTGSGVGTAQVTISAKGN